jgi:mono/diheme cytochrome c family protein
MKRLLKWTAIGLGGFISLLLVAVLALYAFSSARINKRYDIVTKAVTIPTDAEALARGQHLADILGCTDCHGETLTGEPFMEEPLLANLYADNLTAGNGGTGSRYSDADYVRVMRHGVNPEGISVLFMPSQEMNHLSDDDLGALIAFLRAVQPVDNELPDNSVGLLGRILLVTGQLPLLPAELIDHTARLAVAPEPAITIEYGLYLARGCQGCHGPDFAGGAIPGAPPDAPPATNLTPAGNLGNWSEADFFSTMRSGVTPDGRQLDSKWMPWRPAAKMTDDELKAVWLFLQSLPPANKNVSTGQEKLTSFSN